MTRQTKHHELVNALLEAPEFELAAVLPSLNVAELRGLGNDLGLGRAGIKAELVARILGAMEGPKRRAKATSKRATGPNAAAKTAGLGQRKAKTQAKPKGQRRPRIEPISTMSKPTSIPAAELSWITNYIWGIADDCLRDLYVRGKYRDVILPMTVLRRLDAVLVDTKDAVVETKAMLDKAMVVNQDSSQRRCPAVGTSLKPSLSGCRGSSMRSTSCSAVSSGTTRT